MSDILSSLPSAKRRRYEADAGSSKGLSRGSLREDPGSALPGDGVGDYEGEEEVSGQRTTRECVHKNMAAAAERTLDECAEALSIERIENTHLRAQRDFYRRRWILHGLHWHGSDWRKRSVDALTAAQVRDA